jgi:hypothetical protein
MSAFASTVAAGTVGCGEERTASNNITNKILIASFWHQKRQFNNMLKRLFALFLFTFSMSHKSGPDLSPMSPGIYFHIRRQVGPLFLIALFAGSNS